MEMGGEINMPKFNIITNKIYFQTVEYETTAKNADEAFKNYTDFHDLDLDLSDFKNLNEVKESSLELLEEQYLETEEIK